MLTDTKLNRLTKVIEQDPPATLSRHSLSDEVYDALLTQLITLKIAPGSRIAVDALVRELGVSQTPIRGALIRLENEGLVVKTHNVGYSASPRLTYQKFQHIYDMRLLLEPYTAAATAEHLSEATRIQLDSLASDMEASTRLDTRQAYGKFAILDAKFHALIARESGNKLIEEALNRAYAHTHLFRLTSYSGVTREGVIEHAQIINAIVAADIQGARNAMENHIINSRERWKPYFDDEE